MRNTSFHYHCSMKLFSLCLSLLIIVSLLLTGCSADEKIALNAEYQKAINNEQVVGLITDYYTLWGDALNGAKESNDIFVFCNYIERLDDLYSQIGIDLSTAEYMSNQSLIALYYDILSFHQLPLIVDAAKSYENLLDAYGGSLGYEGLQQIVTSLKLLPENELGFESINSMNEIIINAFSGKYVQITELYFLDN